MNALDRFQGGARLMRVSRLLMVLGLGSTAAAMFFEPMRRQAAYSYLLAFTYWAGIAAAALVLLAVFHASGARWMVVLRRAMEMMGLVTIPMALLFIPLVGVLPELYEWIAPPPHLSEHARHLLHHKHAYLNVSFFLVRTALYFAVWIVVALLLFRFSTRQDELRDPALTSRLRKIAAGSLPFLGLSFTFAAFDWLMALDATWFSTIFGVYYFAGSFLAAIALLTVCTTFARGPNLYGELVSAPHFHSLGKLLLGFVAFWAYIAFSQFMLIWAANLPEEVPWYIVRLRGPWKQWSVWLAVVHFVLPFVVLLSRKIKERPRALAAVAVWILLAHFLDLYWVIMPELHPSSPRPHPLDIAALLGVGGAGFSFALWKLRGGFTVPVGDPYLEESMRYTQP